MQTMEKNRLKIMPKELASIIKPRLTAIKNQIEKVNKKLLALIEENPDYQAKNEMIQSMPGIGYIVAFSLLSDMPELGTISHKQTAALVGVAPFNRESGRAIKDIEAFVVDAIKYVYGDDVSNTM
jgi:transposase